MSVHAGTLTQRQGVGISWPWLHSQRWDLGFIIGSCVLVAVPLLLFYQLGVSASAINIIVAALVGGPHMYSTYTWTFLERSFWRKYPVYTTGALLVPVAVVTLAIVDLTLLITGFLFWASLHVLHQIAWLTDCYRAKAGSPMMGWSRLSDYAVLFSSLYPFAAYKLVHGAFIIEERVMPIPAFFKAEWVVVLAWSVFLVSLAVWLAKTGYEARTGQVNGPKTLLIAVAAGIAFVVPTFDNLDVAFQGMNTWHSFQYLALIWYVNRLRAEDRQISSNLVRQIAVPGSGKRYYFSLIGVTAAAGVVIGILYAATGLTFEQSYFMVVLSFLLMHYYFDTFLFTRTGSLVK